MKLRTFNYSVSQGFKNIARNKMFSFASIATMAACIFLLGIFYSIGVNFQSMVKDAESNVAVTVFFQDGMTEDEIKTIGNEIANRPEIAKMEFVSADEAWETFKKEYFEGKEDLAEGFATDNPLANDAKYVIYLNDVSEQEDLVKYLEGVEGVREVHRSEITAKTLSDFNNLSTLIMVAVIAILIGVSIFLISNTVTVGISVRKDEISIMKLIGAKDNFVRAPFVVEGILIGLIGSAIPLVILYFLYYKLVSYVQTKYHMLSTMMQFVPLHTVFKVLIPVSLILGLGIGFLGSRLTLKRHLNV